MTEVNTDIYKDAVDNTNSAYTAAMGPNPNVPAIVEVLKDNARKTGREAIQPALDKAKPVDVSPVIAAIDKEIAPGIQGLKSGLPLSPRQEELWRLRNQLSDPETGETLFDAKRLHEIQSRNGDLAYQYQQSADGNTFCSLDISDQEMVGGCGAVCRRILPPAVGRRSRDPAFVLHDRRGLDRRHRRPPRGNIPDPGGCRHDCAGACAGSPGSSELKELERIFGLRSNCDP